MENIELVKLAYEVCEMNNFRCAITGSLLLVIHGIPMTKPPGDIDFIMEIEDPSDIKVPDGFMYDSQDGGGSEVDAVRFINPIKKIKIEFLYAEEETEDIIYPGVPGDSYEVPCALLENMFEAKINYYSNDKSLVSRKKHKKDLKNLINYMSEDTLKQYKAAKKKRYKEKRTFKSILNELSILNEKN